LKDVLEENELALLDTASLHRREDSAPPFLKELAALKKELLIRYSIPPVFRVEKHNDDVIALADESCHADQGRRVLCQGREIRRAGRVPG
jgi:hypothetical protein